MVPLVGVVSGGSGVGHLRSCDALLRSAEWLVRVGVEASGCARSAMRSGVVEVRLRDRALSEGVAALSE